MFFAMKIFYYVLCYNLIWLETKIYITGEETPSKSEYNNYLLVFNAETVLWQFSIYDVPFNIISEKEPGIIVDFYNNSYKAYDNITNVLKDLKQKGFQLCAILDVCFPPSPCCKSCGEINPDYSFQNLPKREEVDSIFQTMGWTELFHEIIYFCQRIIDGIEKIKMKTGVTLENVLYFDSNEKYDKTMVHLFHIFRYITKNGLTYAKVQDAFTEYSKQLKDKNIRFNF